MNSTTLSAVAEAAGTAALRAAVDKLPRVRFAHLPTPLEEMPRFSQQIGSARVFIKRDDCTGLALGGNKTRHNEFVFGHAQQQGADAFVWGAGVQSNNCRQTAACCAKLGIDCHLILGHGGHEYQEQGNLLLDRLLGATVEIVPEKIGPELDQRIAKVAEQLRQQGRRPYFWDRHIVKPLAAVSYLLCMCEIVEQTAVLGLQPSAVYVCSGGSTGVGLLLAKAVLGLEFPVRNISPIRWPWDTQEDLAKIANQTAELLGLEQRVEPAEVDFTEDYIGEDYGVPSPAGMEALELVAQTEGILLDPTYSAKAMSALIDDARSGRLSGDGPVVFVHTGGTPALFAYRDALVKAIPARKR